MDIIASVILDTLIGMAITAVAAPPKNPPPPIPIVRIEKLSGAPDVGTIGGANGTGVGGSDNEEAQ